MYNTIAEIKERNFGAGRYFFTKKTMQFFKSKIVTGVLHGRYFITSEVNPSNVKRYTLRKALDSGKIETVGKFHAFSTIEECKEYLNSSILE